MSIQGDGLKRFYSYFTAVFISIKIPVRAIAGAFGNIFLYENIFFVPVKLKRRINTINCCIGKNDIPNFNFGNSLF